MRVEIVIDALVLHGVDPRDRHRVADALQGELTHLAASDPELWRHVAATGVLHAPGSVEAPPVAASSPAALGAQLAGALMATLAGPQARAARAPAPPSSAPRSVSPPVLPRPLRRTWPAAAAAPHGSGQQGRT